MKLASGSRWTDLELDDPPEFVFWRAAIWLWERHWTSLNLSSQISKMKIIMPALPVSWISYENENKNKLVLVERFCTLQNALKWRIVIMRTEHSAVGQERWLLAMWPGSGLLPPSVRASIYWLPIEEGVDLEQRFSKCGPCPRAFLFLPSCQVILLLPKFKSHWSRNKVLLQTLLPHGGNSNSFQVIHLSCQV